MRRTYALLAAFCFLVLLKSSAKFASIFAASKLGVSPAEGAGLFTTYALAAMCSGLFGGVLYDCVPGGKMGIGILMTFLNLLNCGGFVGCSAALALGAPASTSCGLGIPIDRIILLLSTIQDDIRWHARMWSERFRGRDFARRA